MGRRSQGSELGLGFINTAVNDGGRRSTTLLGGGRDCTLQRGAQRGWAQGFGTNKASGGMGDAHSRRDGPVPFAGVQHCVGPPAGRGRVFF